MPEKPAKQTDHQPRLTLTQPAAAHAGFDRRRGPGKRLSDFVRSAEAGEFTDEQFVFVQAIEAFKKANAKPYPSWTDILEVVRRLGYRKTLPSEIALPGVADFTEQPDAPSRVHSASMLEGQTGDDYRAAA